jgi:PTS system galactitol-specific IIB component
MSNAVLRIAVACGSGIATSSIAADAVKRVLEENGIDKYEIVKTSMAELPDILDSVDLVLTTNKYQTDQKPHLNVMGFVTGINEDQLKSQLADMLRKLR